MNWELTVDVRGVVIGLLIAGAAGGAYQSMSAQKAERGTQSWELPATGRSHVRVYDTSGVCLYVLYDGSSLPDPLGGIAAIPKTQLPQGAGCQ